MYDSRPDTEAHIDRVRKLLGEVAHLLDERAEVHDRSKLHHPEKSMFDRATEKLKGLEYGSEEYKRSLSDLGPALDHHYRHNRHHPEHFATMVTARPDGGFSWNTEDGVALGMMSLLDLIEMLVDWKAASERHETGDIVKSIAHNRQRFGISEQLTSILGNTAQELGWID